VDVLLVSHTENRAFLKNHSNHVAVRQTSGEAASVADLVRMETGSIKHTYKSDIEDKQGTGRFLENHSNQVAVRQTSPERSGKRQRTLSGLRKDQ
jgi:predicted GNAT family acetyltransferase